MRIFDPSAPLCLEEVRANRLKRGLAIGFGLFLSWTDDRCIQHRRTAAGVHVWVTTRRMPSRSFTRRDTKK